MAKDEGNEPISTPDVLIDETPPASATTATREDPEAVQQLMDEDEVAFGAGFDAARGAEAGSTELTDDAAPKPAAEKPDAQIEKPDASKETSATPEKPAVVAPPVTDDKWTGVSPALRQHIEGMAAQLGQITKIGEDLRRIDGHIGGLTSQQKAIKDALASAKTSTTAQGAATPSATQVQDAEKSSALWKQLKEDYPDWAEAVDLRLAEIAAGRAPSGPAVDPVKLKQELLGEFDGRLNTAVQTAETKGRTLGYLDQKHGPEWEAEIKSPEFDAWIAKQPDATKQLCSSAKVSDASKLIDTYRAARKKSAESTERKQRLANAVTPVGTAVTERTVDEEDAFVGGFEAARGT